MYQPEELKKDKPLKWSTGLGTDVWALFCACVAGDLATVKKLFEKDPSLVRSHYAYRKPLYFAVRENRSVSVLKPTAVAKAQKLSLSLGRQNNEHPGG